MANPRRTITVYPTLDALGTDLGQSLPRYATTLARPRLYQWIPGDTDTTDGINTLGYSGGIPGTWQYVRDYDRGVNLTDAAETLYIAGDVHRVLPTAILSADRTKTLGTTYAAAGDHIVITSQDNSAFLLSIVNGGAAGGTLLTISGPGWCDCEFDGTNWFVRSYGGGANPGANVAAQSAWYINGSTGLDSNPGTSTAPLKTIAEFSRRIQGVRLNTGGIIYVYCQTSLAERVALNIILGDATALWFIGTRSAAVITGTLTSGTRNWDESTQQDGRIIDSTLATSWTSSLTTLRKLIKVTISGGFAEAWIGYDLASKTARISEPFNPATLAGASIASGNAYSVYTLSQFGTDVTVNATCGYGAYVVFQDLELGAATPHSVELNDGNFTLITCKVNGLDAYRTYNCALLGCCTVDGLRPHCGAILQSFSSLHYSVTSPTQSLVGTSLYLSSAYIEGNTLTAQEKSSIEIPAGGWCAVYNPVVDAGGDGVQMRPGSLLRISGRLFGTCQSSGYGVHAEVGSYVAYRSAKPIAITGGTADTIIGGTTKSYATLSTAGYFDAATGTGIVGTSFLRG